MGDRAGTTVARAGSMECVGGEELMKAGCSVKLKNLKVNLNNANKTPSNLLRWLVTFRNLSKTVEGLIFLPHKLINGTFYVVYLVNMKIIAKANFNHFSNEMLL